MAGGVSVPQTDQGFLCHAVSKVSGGLDRRLRIVYVCQTVTYYEGFYMAARFLLSILGAVFFTAGPVSAASLTGVYNTGVSDVEDSDNVSLNIRFHPCQDDTALTCGTVHRVLNPAPDADDTMPDGTPVLGFTMITGLKDKGDGRYRGGKINAVDESISKDKMVWYGFKLDIQDDGSLKAKGCLGPICPRTMVWLKAGE